MKKFIYITALIISVLLCLASWRHLLPFELTEMLGFVTGAWCVWLTVKENIWNWPIGIANSAFFLIVFLKAHLFADSGLQIVYIILGFLGWYWWLYGGDKKTELTVAHSTVKTLLTLIILGGFATWGMTVYLARIADTAPFWDALTTVLSLVAQYLLTKKLIENWHFWILVDIIYIPLYAYKHLYLTAAVYVIFLTMAITGLLEWRKIYAKNI